MYYFELFSEFFVWHCVTRMLYVMSACSCLCQHFIQSDSDWSCWISSFVLRV